jgi:NAD(P)-dependent dehydrogenase (short-subunit alcohol dehydrogenase family)
MDLGLKDKVAIVTGAGGQRGFGRGIALVLAAEGCHILVGDIDLEGAEMTAASVRESRSRAVAVKVDVGDRDQVKSMVDRCLSEFGAIDVLVNNAGVGTPYRPFIESTQAEWERSLDTNLKGTMLCTQAVLPHMLARKQGKIVNLASVAGVISVPKGSVYGATKAAIINFSGAIALEVADSGINVNCVAPGLGNTDFLSSAGGFSNDYIAHAAELDAAGKTITPKDVGDLVAFLVSDVSRHIVGQCIRVSGMT